MSIYRQYLGKDFDRLHPMMQRRFGLAPEMGEYMIGRGVMKEITNAGLHTWPFLLLGTKRNIMFPETGTDIPFTIENYAYIDSYGRETVAWIRQFNFAGRSRNFDATMVYNAATGKVVDYLGTMQHLVVDIDMQVNADGSVTIFSTNQRLFGKNSCFRFPDFLSGNAVVNESYDEKNNLFNISVQVGNKTFRHIFGYKGYFKAEFHQLENGQIPAYAKPKHEEIRQ